MKPTNYKPWILLVEDDASLGFIIKDNLKQDNLEVCLCEDGELGFKAFKNNAFDLLTCPF